MHLNDTGQWAVMWLNTHAGTARSAWALFQTKDEALVFRNTRGGELYVKHSDGSLKRA